MARYPLLKFTDKSFLCLFLWYIYIVHIPPLSTEDAQIVRNGSVSKTKGNEKYEIANTTPNHYKSTPNVNLNEIYPYTTYKEINNENIEKLEHKLCAFVNVSHNASYVIYDREPYSVGLDKIHSTSDIFEKFYSIDIEHGCEVTICRIQLLNPRERERTCFSLNQSQTFEETEKVADPITAQYFVSTGCSCKIPGPGCDKTHCEDVILGHNECGRLFKETSCSECRYDPVILNISASYIPSNGFWCQSYVIRDGCRLSIDMTNGTGQYTLRNYTGTSSRIAMDYIRYPNPSIFSCLCDLDVKRGDKFEEHHSISTAPWILAISSSAGILVVLFAGLLLRKCISIRIERRVSNGQFKDLIKRFKHGFTNEYVKGLTEDVQNPYVSQGYTLALQQPYEHKWEIKRGRILLDHKPLGIGQFGCVYSGQLKKNLKSISGIPVAVKISKSPKDLNCLKSQLEEIKILAFVGTHQNICGLLGACTENIPNKEVLIVLELCCKGSLKSYLRENKTIFLDKSCATVHYVTIQPTGYATIMPRPEPAQVLEKISEEGVAQLIRWSKQIACGMEFLSLKQVIHVDLAARNIFLTEKLECKIGDFGLSQRLHEVVNYVRIGNEYPLPYRWLALESLTDLKFTIQSDIWSYGVTLYEIFSLGADPYANTISGLGELLQFLQDGKRLEKPIHCTEEIYQIMLQCWDSGTMTRPSFGQLKLLFETI